MSVLVWDQAGERYFRTGVEKGVLYPQNNLGAYPAGVAWSGLTGVTVSPEWAEATDIYADDIKYLTLRSAENYKATIEALFSPDEFDECDGSAQLATGMKIGQQPRKAFGFSWQTKLGNDIDLENHGYVIHILYGCTCSPSEKSYQTVNDSPEAMTLSWEIDTVPVAVSGHKASAYVEIDTTELSAAQKKAVEDALYGTTDSAAYLPDPVALAALITNAT